MTGAVVVAVPSIFKYTCLTLCTPALYLRVTSMFRAFWKEEYRCLMGMSDVGADDDVEP